jgi:hypothetical protein
VVLLAERRLSRFGARDTRRPAADPDRAAWDALDAGHDPTVEAPGATRSGRTDGRAPGSAV